MEAQEDCFYCDHAQVEWALDRLGDLLDAGVPPGWIIEKMTEVISLLHHPGLEADASSVPAETGYSTESQAETLSE